MDMFSYPWIFEWRCKFYPWICLTYPPEYPWIYDPIHGYLSGDQNYIHGYV